MQLSYRGISYESNPQMVETFESNIQTQYRGSSCHIRHPTMRSDSQSVIILKFRGNAYIRH